MLAEVFRLLIALFPCTLNAFNIDTGNPLYHFGPNGTFFGFAVAQHFANEQPVVLVGAPRGESGQPQTTQAGAIYSCPLNIYGARISGKCRQVQVEYPTEAEFRSAPRELNSKTLHKEGKNHQLMGFVVQSTGQKHGSAMACAPLLRYGESAYTDGACYLLSSELNHTGVISTCNPLTKKDRHNDYGACEQGFSGYIDEHMILTGLPGARKWTGGVFGRYTSTADIFPVTVDRWTMEVGKEQNGIINILASHDYLGYSVRYGSFGFWYEGADKSTVTIVSGATRYQQTGAVVFLPFKKTSTTDERILGLDQNFTLTGTQMGSGFGHAIEVLDLDADGYDDLVIGAPFEYHFAEDDLHYGGAVYVYYSNGKLQQKEGNNQVFRAPIVLRGRGVHSQFGVSLTRLGNIDNDAKDYQDFAVGAPYSADGSGAVFIFHGAPATKFSTKPTQVIEAKHLTPAVNNPKPLTTFGASLSGGVDFDGNGYGDLSIGAFDSDAIVTFRTRPVVDVALDHSLPEQYIKIDGRTAACPRSAGTCFALTTTLSVLQRSATQLRNVREEPFTCTLEIVPYRKGVQTRALFRTTNRNQMSWPCGREAIQNVQQQHHDVYISKNNQDWVNPLAFNFTVAMREHRSSELLPVVNKKQSLHSFTVSFDKKCGADNDCHTDLSLTPVLINMTRNANGTYLTKVTERDSIVVRFIVENRRERAYFAKLWINYNEDELDKPQMLTKHSSVDMEKIADGLAIFSLGNPLEDNKKLVFDLAFNLVRGSSERVSTSLIFDAFVNSTSVEDNPSDNKWSAEVQLIKEADLQLDGVSRPSIIRFSRGSRSATDEEDIGPQVIHAYTITNHGPFYAKNVTVTINWPLKLNTKRDDWVLYTLEEPLIRHGREVRQCKINPALKAINPAEIYNDETLKLTYGMYGMLRGNARRKRDVYARDNGEENAHVSSIFDSQYIKPKEVTEASGAKVTVVDINCKDQTAVCFPLTCHFDYIGTKESALIEIRARLWNHTFSADYQRIEYVAITSHGHIEVDPQQGIIEDVKNNFAAVTTHAYPDRPYQQQRIEWWIIALAALAGLLLFLILVLICKKCGFFDRKKKDRLLLHQAELSHQRDLYGQ